MVWVRVPFRSPMYDDIDEFSVEYVDGLYNDNEKYLDILLEILELYHSDDRNIITVSPECEPLYTAVQYLVDSERARPIGDNRYLLG